MSSNASNVETLTGQTIGGVQQDISAGNQVPASLEKTNTRTKGPLSRLSSLFGGFAGGTSLIKKVIVAVIIFMILKMTIFR